MHAVRCKLDKREREKGEAEAKAEGRATCSNKVLEPLTRVSRCTRTGYHEYCIRFRGSLENNIISGIYDAGSLTVWYLSPITLFI